MLSPLKNGLVISFQVAQSLGRAGHLHTIHGTVHTPAFMVVRTQGTVKGVPSRQLMEIGPQMTLGNTYQLGPAHDRMVAFASDCAGKTSRRAHLEQLGFTPSGDLVRQVRWGRISCIWRPIQAKGQAP